MTPQQFVDQITAERGEYFVNVVLLAAKMKTSLDAIFVAKMDGNDTMGLFTLFKDVSSEALAMLSNERKIDPNQITTTADQLLALVEKEQRNGPEN